MQRRRIVALGGFIFCLDTGYVSGHPVDISQRVALDRLFFSPADPVIRWNLRERWVLARQDHEARAAQEQPA
jgi:hypothetical protein